MMLPLVPLVIDVTGHRDLREAAAGDSGARYQH